MLAEDLRETVWLTIADAAEELWSPLQATGLDTPAGSRAGGSVAAHLTLAVTVAGMAVQTR